MSKILTSHNIPKKLLDVLHEMGLPKHPVELHLHIVPNDFVTVECKHYLELPDGSLKCDEEKSELIAELKRFKLVELEPEPREIPQA